MAIVMNFLQKDPQLIMEVLGFMKEDRYRLLALFSQI